MSTDITVRKTSVQSENRSWLLSAHGTEPGTTPGITLDASLFTEATHYPDGFIPSGTVIAKVTATGMYGPYDDSAVDGREVAAGILFSSANVAASDAQIGAAMLVHGFVDESKLALIDAAAKADLPLIHFA